MFAGACVTPWNPYSARELAKEIAIFKPDVVHAHNTFPLLSPAVFHGIGSSAATVLTLHNYRLLCPAAIPVRDGKVCTNCIEQRSILPSVRYGCYRASRLATLPLAFKIALHRQLGTWQTEVDAFIALSAFQRNLMIKGGLPGAKLYIKPNFYPGDPDIIPFCQRTGQVVFVGRLSSEKGVQTLIKAWQNWGGQPPELLIVGDGPLKADLELQAQGLPVRFMGHISAEEAQQVIAQARLLVLPSECFEGFPMVVREAFAFGTPVAVSNLGPLSDIVQENQNGVLFEPANPASLLSVVRSVWSNHVLLAELSRGARQAFDTFYNENANYQLLMQIYQRAIDANQRRTV
jgi:glycosyltransferase involved in cell wall biosynthesis